LIGLAAGIDCGVGTLARVRGVSEALADLVGKFEKHRCRPAITIAWLTPVPRTLSTIAGSILLP